MDGVISTDAARDFISDSVLWPAVRDFLWDFAPQIHGTWLEGLAVARNPDADGAEDGAWPDISQLMSSPRVKRFILTSLDVRPFFHTFPKDDWSRLALLDGATLESIVKWLGAIACAESLRRVTAGAIVRTLKAELSGIYPDVFAYTAYFAGFDLGAKDAEIPEGIMPAGLGMLFSLLDACPAPLVARLRLKFPKRFCDLCVHGGETKARTSANGAVKKLLKLKFPKAYSLCCL